MPEYAIFNNTCFITFVFKIRGHSELQGGHWPKLEVLGASNDYSKLKLENIPESAKKKLGQYLNSVKNEATLNLTEMLKIHRNTIHLTLFIKHKHLQKVSLTTFTNKVMYLAWN